MAHVLIRDPRLRDVEWRDLAKPRGGQIARELLLVIPWLAASLVLAHFAARSDWLLYLPALACSFLFFLTGLRVVHNAYHHALGIPRWATDGVICGLSLVMGWPLHAVMVNHLRHHKYCMGEGDIEALSARMRGWQAIVFGPVFPFLLLGYGYYHGRRAQRAWIVVETLFYAVIVAVVLLVLEIPCLRYHVCSMAIGQCLTAFFAVWTVHHDCDRQGVFARTTKARWKNALTFNMFLHMEHHLFPAVPTCNLQRLADRLHAVAPDLRDKEVI